MTKYCKKKEKSAYEIITKLLLIVVYVGCCILFCLERVIYDSEKVRMHNCLKCAANLGHLS